jgi:hypothetical protein
LVGACTGRSANVVGREAVFVEPPSFKKNPPKAG